MKRKRVSSLRGIYEPLNFSGQPFFGLFDIRSAALENYGMTLSAPYQRGRVWTPKQQSDFVGHLLEGGVVLPVIVNTGPDGSLTPGEIVDGKQRVTAVLEWAEKGLAATLCDGRTVFADDLDDVSRRRCSNMIGMVFGIVRMTTVECMELYLKINRGGTPHTADDLFRVEMMLKEARRHAPAASLTTAEKAVP